MKICLDARVSSEYLKKADEIKVQQRDLDIVTTLFEKYPDATVIPQIYAHQEKYSWKDLNDWYILSRRKMILCLGDIDDIKEAVKLGIPCFYGYPLRTFDDLNSFKALGVSYVRLGTPLIFMMKKVVEALGEGGPKIRLIPNLTYMDTLPHENGIVGGWIRPEDLYLYDPYTYSAEFDGVKPRKEEALFRIYFDDKAWPGPLGMIIEGLNDPATNRLIDDKLTEMRLNCEQKCLSGGVCRRCYRELALANTDLYTPEVLASFDKLRSENP